MRPAHLLVGVVITSACRQPSPPRPPTEAAASVQAAAPEPAPGPKDIIRAVLAHHDIRLSAHSSCNGVATDPADTTIGEYLAGFLGLQTEDSGKNWIEASCGPASSPHGNWQCRFVIRRRNPEQEEVWGWGVRFLMRADRSAVRESFECIGSG